MPDFAQSRETTVNATPDRLHDLINDFTHWARWSPWEALDPNLQRTYSGNESGVGAKYAWEGNKQVGTGRMEILSSTPSQIAVDLEFLKPFKARNKAVFDLIPAGEQTRVVWTMSGTRNVLMAVAGKLFFDKAIGKDFDKGLANLKRVAETG